MGYQLEEGTSFLQVSGLTRDPDDQRGSTRVRASLFASMYYLSRLLSSLLIGLYWLLILFAWVLLQVLLAGPLEWLWQRRVEPVASISGHLRAALDFVGKSVERFSLLRMLIVPLLLTYVVVVFAGVCLLVLIEWLCWLALLMPRAFSGVLGWWHKALLALFSYGLQQPSDRRRIRSARQTTPQPDQRAV